MIDLNKRAILVNIWFCPEDIVDDYLETEFIYYQGTDYDINYLYPDVIHSSDEAKERYKISQDAYYRDKLSVLKEIISKRTA